MKVGLVLDDSLDKPDGVQQYVLSIGHWLSEQGHEVHYLVGSTARTDIPNVHSLARNVHVRFNHNRMTIPLPASYKRLSSLLRDIQFDVLHVQMPYSPWLAARIIMTAPKTTAICGTFHIIAYSRLERLATRLLGMWLWPSLRRFDRVWSVSQPAQEFALHNFKVKSAILPNVVNFDSWQPITGQHVYTKKPLKIIYFGRLVPRKGGMEMLRALSYLNNAKSNTTEWHADMAGSGKLEARLKRYVKKSGLVHRVQFKGFIPEKDKMDLLANADIAIFPSIGGESFGIVLIEAMAAGAGVVMGGDNAGYRSILNEWPECLVNPRDSKAFASKLKYMLDNPKFRTRIGSEQHAAVKQFDITRVGARILSGYQSAIAKRQLDRDN
jgi:phosphatidyl-myo-inositol alpha-mannosyltransferase